VGFGERHNPFRGHTPPGRARVEGEKDLTKSCPWVCLCCHYDQIAGAGGGNYHEIVGFHNPKDVIADYRDFDEDPHNRYQKQHDGYHKQRLETFGQAVDGEPKKISADQDPKGVGAKYRNFIKDSHDCSVSHRERDNASEEIQFGPQSYDRATRGKGKNFADKEEADSVGLIRFAIMAGNAYFEAMSGRSRSVCHGQRCWSAHLTD
jgi:hypothetical protein